MVEELGLADEIPVAALAKRFEEVFVPGRADPIRIPRQSEALYLLQRIRDEAHRFAIDYHRNLRGKRMTRSVLDDIPGLGPTRRKRLLKELGGVRAVKAGRRPTISGRSSWLPDMVADAVYAKIHGAAARRATMRLNYWETHAGWWQEGFTGGADPEYEEQILPLADEVLAGFDRVLDVGCGEGQVARRLTANGTDDGRRGGSDAGPNCSRPGTVAEDRRYARAGAGRAAVRRRRLRRRRRLSRVRAHPRGRRAPSARWPASCGRAAGSRSSSTTRCSRCRTAAGSMTRCSIRPSSTGVSGRTWSRTSPIEQVAPGVFLPFIHRPLSRYVNTLARHGLAHRPAWRNRRRRPASSPWHPSTSRPRRFPRLLLLVTDKTRRVRIPPAGASLRRRDDRIRRDLSGSRAPAGRRSPTTWRTLAGSSIDNVPPTLIPKLGELAAAPGSADRVALVVRAADYRP